MNSIIIICAILISCQLTLAKKDVSSIFLYPSTSTSCDNHGLKCKDCETLQYCSNGSPLFEIKCADQSKSRPYCDSETNTCVKAQPAVCNVEESSFSCPNVGTFPDLENCNKYYTCDENKVATNNACPVGHIYDHAVKGCSPGKSCKSYSSKTGQCKGKINKLIAYAPSRDLYILCLSGKHSMIFQCHVEGEIFNELDASCQFECVKPGYFPYPEDVTKFYSCVQNGKKFLMNLLDCPTGTQFENLGEGQGICSIQVTTEEPVNEEEGSGEAEQEAEQEAENNEAELPVPVVLNLFNAISVESPESVESAESVESSEA